MAIRKLISLKVVLQDVMDDMGIENTRMIPVLTRWAIKADQAIGGFNTYKQKICVKVFDHCRVELPCNIVSLHRGFLWGDHGCECELQVNELNAFLSLYPTVGGSIFGVSIFENMIRCGTSGYTLQDNMMIFDQDHDGESITIPYLAYEEDEDGFIKVNENHIEAISCYVQLKMSKRSRWSSKEYRLSETAIANLKEDWNDACKDARASDGKPTAEEDAIIISMLNDPYSGAQNLQWLYGPQRNFIY